MAGCVALRDGGERRPPDLTETIDLRGGLRERVRSSREKVVVAVENERLAEEGAQDEVLAGVEAEVGAQQPRQAAGDEVKWPPGGEGAGIGRAIEPGALVGVGDPGIGSGSGDSVKAAGAQRAGDGLGESLVRRDHDTVHGDAGGTFA